MRTTAAHRREEAASPRDRGYGTIAAGTPQGEVQDEAGRSTAAMTSDTTAPISRTAVNVVAVALPCGAARSATLPQRSSPTGTVPPKPIIHNAITRPRTA